MFLDGTNLLKPHMLENMDYILVPEDAWSKLIKWYSLQNGQVLALLLQLELCHKPVLVLCKILDRYLALFLCDLYCIVVVCFYVCSGALNVPFKLRT